MAINPSSLPNMVLWFKADTGVALDGAGFVTGWTNQARSGNNATVPSNALAPKFVTSPYPAVRFYYNGPSVYDATKASALQVSNNPNLSSAANALTYFVVCRIKAVDQGFNDSTRNNERQALISVEGSNAQLFVSSVDTQGCWTMFNNAGSINAASTVRATSGIGIFAARTNSTNVKIFNHLGATQTLTGNFLGNAPTTTNINDVAMTIGRSIGTGLPLYGDIFEIMRYNGTLSDADINSLLEYAKEKYDFRTSKGILCVEGSSTSWGFNDPFGHGWTGRLYENSYQKLKNFVYINYGRGGVSPIQDFAAFTSDVASGVDHAVTLSTGEKILFVQGGSNDLYASGLTGVQAFDALKTYCQNRKSAGYNKIAVMTVLPRGNPASIVFQNNQRLDFNSRVRAEPLGPYWDYVVDVASDPAFADGTQLSTAYYETDAVHLNAQGHGIVAQYFKNAVDSLLSVSQDPTVRRDLGGVGNTNTSTFQPGTQDILVEDTGNNTILQEDVVDLGSAPQGSFSDIITVSITNSAPSNSTLQILGLEVSGNIEVVSPLSDNALVYFSGETETATIGLRLRIDSLGRNKGLVRIISNAPAPRNDFSFGISCTGTASTTDRARLRLANSINDFPVLSSPLDSVSYSNNRFTLTPFADVVPIVKQTGVFKITAKDADTEALLGIAIFGYNKDSTTLNTLTNSNGSQLSIGYIAETFGVERYLDSLALYNETNRTVLFNVERMG